MLALMHADRDIILNNTQLILIADIPQTWNDKNTGIKQKSSFLNIWYTSLKIEIFVLHYIFLIVWTVPF